MGAVRTGELYKFKNSEEIVRQSESPLFGRAMKLIVLIFGIISAGVPPSWSKRYNDFMTQFEGKGTPLGWFVQTSKFPLHTDMRNGTVKRRKNNFCRFLSFFFVNFRQFFDTF